MQYVSYSKLGRNIEDHPGVSPMRKERANQKSTGNCCARSPQSNCLLSTSPSQDYRYHNLDWGWDNNEKKNEKKRKEIKKQLLHEQTCFILPQWCGSIENRLTKTIPSTAVPFSFLDAMLLEPGTPVRTSTIRMGCIPKQINRNASQVKKKNIDVFPGLLGIFSGAVAALVFIHLKGQI